MSSDMNTFDDICGAEFSNAWMEKLVSSFPPLRVEVWEDYSLVPDGLRSGSSRTEPFLHVDPVASVRMEVGHSFDLPL